MKKIIHIINGLDLGGAETALYRLLQITYETYQLHVIVLNQTGYYSKKITELGVSVEYLNIKNNPIMACWRLKTSLQQHQPDIVQTWLYHADLIGGLIATYCGVKHIIWGIRCEGVGLKKSTALIQLICAKLSDKIPSHIVTNSKKAADYHIRIGYQANKVRVIHNGFDTALFKPKHSHIRNELEKLFTSDSPHPTPLSRLHPLSFPRRRESVQESSLQATSGIDSRPHGNDSEHENDIEHSREKECRTDNICDNTRQNTVDPHQVHSRTNLIFIGTLARFHADKGYDTFIASIDPICDRHPNARFILCGHGCHAQNQILNTLLGRLHHQNKVILINGTEDPIDYLNALDIFVLPSNTEGFPNSLAEAMLCALPCIATDVGETRLICGEHAILISKENPDELAQACLAMIKKKSSECIQLGKLARNYIEQSFSMEIYKQNFKNIYEK